MVRSFQKASLQGSLPPPMGSVHRAVVMGHSLSCPGTCPQLPAVPRALVLLHTFSNLLVHRANVTKPTLPKTPSAVKSTWLAFAGGGPTEGCRRTHLSGWSAPESDNGKWEGLSADAQPWPSPAGLESIHFFCDQAHAKSKKEVLRGNMFKTCRVSFLR